MSLEILKLQSPAEMDAFISFPRQITARRHKGPASFPETPASFSHRLNPVHRHIETAYFMAYRERVPAGRIAAIRDQLNPHRERGFFGCFECQNDPDAAALLLEAARKWLRGRGCSRMIGPATFNTNQKVGLLAEGDPAPQPMIPSNPLYYNDLMIKAGMQKHTDLYTFSWRTGTGLDSKMLSRAAGAGKMPGVDIKRLGADGSARETLLVRDLFNGSMSGNWGFIPLTTDESAAMLKYCRAHADPDLLITVWYRGRPAGLFIFLPTGLSPGVSPTSVRAAVLGVLPPFRRTGLASYMIGYLEEIISRKGYRRVDLSMVHEENGTVLDLVSRTGAKAAGLFRVYGS